VTTASNEGAEPAAPNEGGAEPAVVLDCLGQRCPLPVIALARGIGDVGAGSVIRVLADDPAAAIDIPAWCRLRGHEYVGRRTVGGRPGYDVRRSGNDRPMGHGSGSDTSFAGR